MRIKVSDGYQLGGDDGKVYQPGESFEASKADGDAWVAAGMAVKVKVKVKAVTSSKNKAVTGAPNKAAPPSTPGGTPPSSGTPGK